jgi:DNA uptake protein ComE-like DNA-binding protein
MRTSALLIALSLLGTAACRPADETPPATDTTAGPAPAPATPAPTTDGGMLDPETAPREQLVAVPGMTEAFADRIIGARPIANMLEVDSILSSLSETARDTIYTRIWKPLDLNTASAQEILLVPGVGPRLQHEFEEYRPYTDMAQFRREMGKYVDNNEVERLSKYVTIR